MAIIDGRAIARRRQETLKRKIETLSQDGVVPTIACILIGDDDAAAVYYRAKSRLATRLGIRFVGLELPGTTSQAEIVHMIRRLNNDRSVDGIFIELPLPGAISIGAISCEVAPEKDIDGINPLTVGRMVVVGAESDSYVALNERRDILLPATPQAVMELLLESGIDLVGRDVVVIGRSLAVGRPLSLLLLTEGATVTVCHSKTRNLSEIMQRADVVCVAVGRPRFVTADMVKDEAVVMDVGINVTEEGIVGDVDFGAVAPKAKLITPVPGGVGPMTTTMIMENVVKCARRSD